MGSEIAVVIALLAAARGFVLKPAASMGSAGAVHASSELQSTIDKMREADVDLATSGQMQFNFGSPVSGTADVSKQPLFQSLDQKVLKFQIASALIDIYNADLFAADVCSKEPEMTGARKKQLWAFVGLLANTTIFGHAFEYLQSKGVATGTIDTFKGKLFNLWFGTYTRCSGTLGSSGFEHVFLGEMKGSTVDGLHNWIRYYLLEKAGQINYFGYYHYSKQHSIGTFQYKWEGSFKKQGGFLLGSSPAFDFSVLTVCVLTAPGAKACRFSIDGASVTVTSYTQACAVGTCISTAYPSDV